ncbi:MAG: Assimilatory nitrite reductase [NAD(P)H] small subunit [Phycisphaerae bacterium]|nr:Assimilatory nitrite reductase [NAD(P)H] small subunit [Phycisphaerae bacterium]
MERICQVADLFPGRGRFVVVGDHELAVFLIDGEVHVIENACPHMGGNLSAGQVHRGAVTCPQHNWPFDLATGRCPDSPDVTVRRFDAEIRSGVVFACLDEQPQGETQ